MTKKFILAVAVLLLSAGGVAAATQLRFNQFCDGMQLQSADGTNFTATETGACLQGTSVIGSGKVTGRRLKLIVNWRGFTGAKDKKRYILQFPLQNEAKFKEYALQSGKWVLLNKGTYIVQP